MNGHLHRAEIGAAHFASRGEKSIESPRNSGQSCPEGSVDKGRFLHTYTSPQVPLGSVPRREVRRVCATDTPQFRPDHPSDRRWGHKLAVITGAIAISLFNTTISANPQVFGFELPEPMKPSSGSGGLVCSGNCPVATTDVVRFGTQSLKSVVDRLNSPNMFRTEASHTFQWEVNKGADTTDYWSGFSVYIPGPYPAMTEPVYEIIYQVHTSPPDGDWSGYNGMNPPLALFLQPESDTSGAFMVLIKATNDPYPQTTNQSVYSKKITYKTDKWYDFVVQTRLDSTSAGFTKIWVDGELFVNYSGMNYFRGHGPAYAKFGFYNGWRIRDIPGERVSVRTIYHDEYRFGFGSGVGYESVSPGGAPAEGDGLMAPSELRLIEP